MFLISGIILFATVNILKKSSWKDIFLVTRSSYKLSKFVHSLKLSVNKGRFSIHTFVVLCKYFSAHTQTKVENWALEQTNQTEENIHEQIFSIVQFWSERLGTISAGIDTNLCHFLQFVQLLGWKGCEEGRWVKLFQLLQIAICAIILIPHFQEIIDHRASLIFNWAATCLRLPFLGTAESWKQVQSKRSI